MATRSVKSLATVCLVLLHVTPVFSREDKLSHQLVPRRAWFAEADLLSVAMTSDGARLALIETKGGKPAVSLAAPAELDKRQELSLPSNCTPIGCQWAVDNGRLLVTALRAADSRVLVFDATGNLEGELVPDVAGSLEIVQLSEKWPDRVLLASRDKDNALAYWQGSVGATKSEPVLEAKDIERAFFDADWKPRAAQHTHPDGTTEILRRDGETWTRVYVMEADLMNPRRQPRSGVAGTIGLDQSGDELLLVDNSQHDRSQLVSLNLASGARRELAADADADLSPNAIVDRRTGNVLGVSAYFGELRRHLLDDSIRDDFAFLKKELAASAGFANISANDSAWLVVPLDGGPFRFHMFDRQNQRLTLIGSTHSALNGVALARRTAHVVKSRDGLSLPCHLYVSPRLDADGNGLPDTPCPTLLYVHGGPTIVNPWDGWFANRCLQLLADRGYAVLNVDFRGAGGYGKEFVKRIWGNWGRATVSDFEDIAAWAVEQKIAKADKIGIWGWSYGGLSTFSALTFSPDTFACGISMYGLSDMEMFARYASLSVPRQHVHATIGNPTTEEGAAALRAQSPLFAAQNVKRPLLITHGAKDLVATRKHSDQFVQQLEQHGQHPIYLLYPNEGHDYRAAQSWISFWAVAERFLHEHLGGDFEPAGDDLRNPPFQIIAGRDLIPDLEPEASPKSNM